MLQRASSLRRPISRVHPTPGSPGEGSAQLWASRRRALAMPPLAPFASQQPQDHPAHTVAQD